MTVNSEPTEVSASRGFGSVALAKMSIPSGLVSGLLFSPGQDKKGGGSKGKGAERVYPARPLPAASPSLSNIKQLNRHDLEPDKKSLSDYTKKALVPSRGQARWVEAKDTGDGVAGWMGDPRTSADLKRAYRLVENLKDMGREYGTEKLGFLTLTFVENMTDPKEAQRRFNSLMTNLLRRLFPDYVVVMEPQKRGAIHYHLVVYCAQDVRSGFDFEAVSDGDYKSANSYLRELWKQLREAMPKFGFGRSELMPIRTNDEGIAKYVGKYLDKGNVFKGPQYKGMRTVRYRQRPRVVGPRFSWVVQGAEWRDIVATIARLAGVSDSDGMAAKYGKHWAFWIRLALKSQDGAEIPAVELFRRFEFFASCASHHHAREVPVQPPAAETLPPPLPSFPPALLVLRQPDFVDLPAESGGDAFLWCLDITNPF